MLSYLLLFCLCFIPSQAGNITEELCVLDSKSVRQCLQWKCDVTKETLEACAAVFVHYTCGLLQHDALISNCCDRDRACLSTLYQSSLNKLKFGKRVDNPKIELDRRRNNRHQDKLVQRLEHIIETVQQSNTDEKKILVIQVGAHVGAIKNDPIYPYLATLNMMHGILFEPMKIQYQGLTYNYRHALSEKRVRLINAAVCKEPGQMSFVHKKTPDTSQFEAYETGAHTTYSNPLFNYMYRDNDSQLGTLGTMVSEIDTINAANNGEAFMESTVECTTLKNERVVATLLKTYPKAPLILIVDAEGTDVVVLKEMLTIKRPDLIVYEHTHVDVKEALQLMNKYKYVCSYYQLVDTVCVKRLDGVQSVKSMSIDVSHTAIGINLGFEVKNPLLDQPVLEINEDGMSIENQVTAYCSIQKVSESDCDSLLLRLKSQK